ncbi:hypothetical protein E4H12_15625 [Candidatus Thorarchaeota archaeon]|nr:MAG: hypothetical protein E4H12_15625 [Candidatus Thorarchaeota archaeon]
MPLNRLDNLLTEIASFEPIEYVDLYGGEVALLSEDYMERLFAVIEKYCSKPVSVITNLSAIHPSFIRHNVILSVSYDFDCREKHELVFQNMMKYPDDLHVLMLAGQCLIQKDVDEMIGVLNMIRNVQTVEIKPYSTNQYNAHGVSFKDFEEFVKKWITSPVEKRFEFTNEDLIESSLAGVANAFSDDHVYITPSGELAVLDFDLNDNEYFHHLQSFQQYLDWAEREKTRVHLNGYCGQCKYLGHCLSEHLREVQNMEQSCNGFKHLLDWYKDERMEASTANNT